MSTTMNRFAKKTMGGVMAFLLAVTMAVGANAEAPSDITDNANPVTAESDVLDALMQDSTFRNDIAAEAPDAEMIDTKYLSQAKENYVVFEKDTIVSAKAMLNGSNCVQHKKDFAVVVAASDFTNVGSSSSSRNETDSSNSIRIYTTIYYDVLENDGREFDDLTKVTGYYNWTTSNGTTISKQNVRLGQTGWSIGSYVNQYKDYGISSNNWTQYPVSSWEPVLAGSNEYVGATYTVTLRGSDGQTWTVELSNNI